MTRKHLPALLLAVGVLAAAPACAQTYGYGGYRDYRGDIGRRAYDNGYREGLDKGQSDARRGRSFDFQRHDDYRDADDGYSRSWGNKDDYRRVFRQGFVAGYNEGYRANARAGYPAPGYPAYPGNPGRAYPRPGTVYGSPAAENGYRDGLKVGRDDAHDGESYDPVRSHYYREGDNDYDGRYGSKDQYKREYRAAFERGYADGYRTRRW